MGHSKKKKKIVIKKEQYSPFFDDVYWMIQKGKKGGNFFLKKWSNRITRVETWVFWKPRSEKRNQKKKGTCWEARCFRNCSRSPSRAIESSRVESSSSNGPFFLFCFTTLLDAYVSLFFLFFLLLIRMSCDLLYLRGGGRGWSTDAVAGIKRLHFFEW